MKAVKTTISEKDAKKLALSIAQDFALKGKTVTDILNKLAKNPDLADFVFTCKIHRKQVVNFTVGKKATGFTFAADVVACAPFKGVWNKELYFLELPKISKDEAFPTFEVWESGIKSQLPDSFTISDKAKTTRYNKLFKHFAEKRERALAYDLYKLDASSVTVA